MRRSCRDFPDSLRLLAQLHHSRIERIRVAGPPKERRCRRRRPSLSCLGSGASLVGRNSFRLTYRERQRLLMDLNPSPLAIERNQNEFRSTRHPSILKRLMEQEWMAPEPCSVELRASGKQSRRAKRWNHEIHETHERIPEGILPKSTAAEPLVGPARDPTKVTMCLLTFYSFTTCSPFRVFRVFRGRPLFWNSVVAFMDWGQPVPITVRRKTGSGQERRRQGRNPVPDRPAPLAAAPLRD